MVDNSDTNRLTSQAASSAARAGLWLTVGGAALFLVGVLTGLTLDRRLMGEPVAAEDDRSAGGEARIDDDPTGTDERVRKALWLDGDYEPGSPEMLDAVARRVREILKLDAAQEKQVRAIIDKYHPRMEEMRQRFEPELRRLAIEALGDFWPVLQTEQRERLERILGRHGRWLIRSVTQPTSTPALLDAPVSLETPASDG